MVTDSVDNDSRRAYWVEQMDTAYEFMEEICRHPVEECGERLSPLCDAVDAAGVEVVFSESRLADKHDRLFFLREGLVEDFVAAARAMNNRGWVLKVEDAFRSREMQTYLGKWPRVFDGVLRKVLWETGGTPPGSELMFRRISALVATRPKIGTHMSGSALDISVLRRDDGSEVPRGAPYIELSELTPMESPFVDEEARRNRREITALMAAHGFQAYPYEFWHYSKGDAYAERLNGSLAPAKYGAVDFDPSTGEIAPIADPLAPLHALEDIEQRIGEAMHRVSRS